MMTRAPEMTSDIQMKKLNLVETRFFLTIT